MEIGTPLQITCSWTLHANQWTDSKRHLTTTTNTGLKHKFFRCVLQWGPWFPWSCLWGPSSCWLYPWDQILVSNIPRGKCRTDVSEGRCLIQFSNRPIFLTSTLFLVLRELIVDFSFASSSTTSNFSLRLVWRYSKRIMSLCFQGYTPAHAKLSIRERTPARTVFLDVFLLAKR